MSENLLFSIIGCPSSGERLFHAGSYCISVGPTVESRSHKPTPPALWFSLFGACVVRKSYSPNPHARITYPKETKGDDFGPRSARLRDGGGSPGTSSEVSGRENRATLREGVEDRRRYRSRPAAEG